MKGKTLTLPDEIPQGEHWAILTRVYVCIPGDQRSRTNPGHGYPATTEYHISYLAFTDQVEFEKEMTYRIERRRSLETPVVGIHVQGVYKPVIKVELVENS